MAYKGDEIVTLMALEDRLQCERGILGFRVPEACINSVSKFCYAGFGCLVFHVPRMLALDYKPEKVIVRSTVLTAGRNVKNEMDRE